MIKKFVITCFVVLVSTFLFQANLEAQCVLSTVEPENVTAIWFRNGTLSIMAEGHAQCPYPAKSEIIPGPESIIPPVNYLVKICEGNCEIYAPYRVTGTFHYYKTMPKSITIVYPGGSKQVPVHSITEVVGKKTVMPKCLSEELGPNEAIGIAPNSFDITRAYSNAVEQLQKRFPGQLNAVVEEIGSIGAGTPIGIFYTYVKVKQQN